jgi:hypothetical protein
VPSANLLPSLTIKVKHPFSQPASSELRSGNDLRSIENLAGNTMTRHTYDKATTALLIIDPYNDFLSGRRKI